MSNSLRPHESQHTRPPCPLPTPGVYSNSCPSSWWCHPAISSSIILFSSCPQSLPASESFPMSQLFTWGGQSIGVSALVSVLQMNTQDWSPLEWTGWISLQSKDSQESSPTPQFKSINSLVLSFLYTPTLTSIHDYWKNHSSYSSGFPTPALVARGDFFFWVSALISCDFLPVSNFSAVVYYLSSLLWWIWGELVISSFSSFLLVVLGWDVSF